MLWKQRSQQRAVLGERAASYLGRALRIWFPHPGSLVVTGTPVCFPDVVVTAAHVYLNIGDGTAKPLGLRVSIPDLERPGEFRDTTFVTDYTLSDLGRRYDPNQPPEVRNDFLVLQLKQALPPDLIPLSLMPYDQLANSPPPRCDRATINAAYHSDLGLLNGRVVSASSVSGAGRVSARGAVPLLTLSSRLTPKSTDGARFGRWYADPYVVFPEHDTHESASGSALVCPSSNAAGQPRDYLHGLMVGQLFLSSDANADSAYRPAINVATVNLPGIYRAIAALKKLPVETLHRQCEPFLQR